MIIETKQPKVFLYSQPMASLSQVALAVSAWHSDDFCEYWGDMDFDKAEEFAGIGVKAYHKVALEYINLTFVIKNVSRAFQQQLTRTRLASYSIQSLRVVAKQGFAQNGHFTLPPNLNDDQKADFCNAMLEIEARYEYMVANGAKVEDARGMLPLNIHSDISMHISMAALIHMLTQRFCVNTQWEYRQVATQMKELVRTQVHPMFSAMMEAPCVKTKKCPMGKDYCGVPVWKLDEPARIDFYKNYMPTAEPKKVQ